MPKYRKKPVVIEAVKIAPENYQEIMEMEGVTLSLDERLGYGGPLCAYIETLEGTMRGDLGDWIITGVEGEKYPCKPGIFEATYEPVGN